MNVFPYAIDTITGFYHHSQRSYRFSFDCIEFYRRTQRGYCCSNGCTEIYRRSHAGYV